MSDELTKIISFSISEINGPSFFISAGESDTTIFWFFDLGEVKPEFFIAELTLSISKMDFYEREKAVPELAKLKQELESLTTAQDETGKIKIQVSQLEKEIEGKRKIYVSGYLQYIVL